MLDKLKKIIADLFQVDPTLKEHWETDKYGPVPKFPVIVYDKSIKDDFRFFIRPDQYYCDEFIGQDPDPEEIIIDSNGQVFALTLNHAEKFRVPKLLSSNFSVDELKTMLTNYWNIKDVNQYLRLISVIDIINKMTENKTDFGYRPDRSTTA